MSNTKRFFQVHLQAQLPHRLGPLGRDCGLSAALYSVGNHVQPLERLIQKGA